MVPVPVFTKGGLVLESIIVYKLPTIFKVPVPDFLTPGLLPAA